MSRDMLGPIPRALIAVPDEYHGTLLDVVNRLGAKDVVKAATFARNLKRFLRSELVVSEPTRNWREQDGIISSSVTTDGTTGEDWITRLESQGFRLNGYAKSILRSSDFKPTSGVTYEVVVLMGRIFTDSDRMTSKIRAYTEVFRTSDQRKLLTPKAELACLIREKFTDEDIEAMGLSWIVVMHEPIKDSLGDPSLLGADRLGGGRWLDACSGRPGGRWVRDGGFAFAVSQVGA